MNLKKIGKVFTSKFEGRTDQRNAQINFSIINLLLFKLLRHVSAIQLEPSSGSLKWNAETSQHSTVSTSPHEYSTQQHPSILTDCNGL